MNASGVPAEYVSKVDTLRDYFQVSKPNLTVHISWDFDLRCASFRFDQEAKPSARFLLKIGCDLLADFTPEQVIRKLEAAKWQGLFDTLDADQVAIFAETGFIVKPKTP
jgi:hypothetical protein